MSDRYFVLDADHNPVAVDLHEWGRFTDDPAKVRVAETTVGDRWVSTVFLGMNHRLIGDGPPILFETMVFDHSETPTLDESYMERYETWDVALAGHGRVVAALHGRPGTMTDALIPNTAVAEWKPDLGKLPDGWQIVEIVLQAGVTSWRHAPHEAEITLRYDPFGQGCHEVRLSVVPHTPPVAEWLYPFLEAMMKVPWPARADITFPGLFYP